MGNHASVFSVGEEEKPCSTRIYSIPYRLKRRLHRVNAFGSRTVRLKSVEVRVTKTDRINCVKTLYDTEPTTTEINLKNILSEDKTKKYPSKQGKKTTLRGQKFRRSPNVHGVRNNNENCLGRPNRTINILCQYCKRVGTVYDTYI